MYPVEKNRLLWWRHTHGTSLTTSCYGGVLIKQKRLSIFPIFLSHSSCFLLGKITERFFTVFFLLSDVLFLSNQQINWNRILYLSIVRQRVIHWKTTDNRLRKAFSNSLQTTIEQSIIKWRMTERAQHESGRKKRIESSKKRKHHLTVERVRRREVHNKSTKEIFFR